MIKSDKEKREREGKKGKSEKDEKGGLRPFSSFGGFSLLFLQRLIKELVTGFLRAVQDLARGDVRWLADFGGEK